MHGIVSQSEEWFKAAAAAVSSERHIGITGY